MPGSGSSATAWRLGRYVQTVAVQTPDDRRPGPKDALAHPAVAWRGNGEAPAGLLPYPRLWAEKQVESRGQ